MSENLLKLETSPYLLQHQDNPVHWRPWGPEALAEAARENKPILLSVGYAACHWCHVMAHESFEDPTLAEQMNALFINIKVDREERPDIDTIYQSALAMLGQQGGWPLTMFLTPQGEPFWGGTYFPPESLYGRPGFKDVLTSISRTYHERRDDIARNVEALRDGLAALSRPLPGDGISEQTANDIGARLFEAMDKIHGGFGDAPKFPQPSLLRQLWNTGLRTRESRYHNAVLFALREMCEGGIYDHLGGGFARYTVDRIWLVPHFEKMLYDNAQLLDLLGLAWSATGEDLFRRRAEETVAWLLSDMQETEGGFASARDADSEGEEGKFYVWQEEEIDRLLPADLATLFKQHYDVTRQGNWEDSNILNRLYLTRDPDEDIEVQLGEARTILLKEREKREAPLKDDKVLTDWNGLVIAALARTGRLFRQPEWIEAAVRAFDFVSGTMSEGKRLHHSYRAGRARHAATLEDYAAMIRAALALYEAKQDPLYLESAVEWVAILDTHYRDATGGAYFLTPDDAEALVTRTKSGGDDATPSGNGIMVTCLGQLAVLTGQEVYRTRAHEIVRCFAGELDRNGFACSSLIDGALFLEQGVQIVIVAPCEDDPKAETLRRAAESLPLLERSLTLLIAGDPLPQGHPAAGKGLVDGKAAAYVCRGPVCSLPITDAKELAAALGGM